MPPSSLPCSNCNDREARPLSLTKPGRKVAKAASACPILLFMRRGGGLFERRLGREIESLVLGRFFCVGRVGLAFWNCRGEMAIPFFAVERLRFG